MTELEEGVIVKILSEELAKLMNKKGFLERQCYPEFYEKIALENEVGRFLIVRFLLDG